MNYNQYIDNIVLYSPVTVTIFSIFNVHLKQYAFVMHVLRNVERPSYGAAYDIKTMAAYSFVLTLTTNATMTVCY